MLSKCKSIILTINQLDNSPLKSFDHAKIVTLHIPVRMKQVAKSIEVSDGFGYFKSLKWSPDGQFIGTNSSDNQLRVVYPFSGMQEDSIVNEICCGEAVSDFDWYPLMQSMDPSTVCVAVATRNHPVRLYDAFTAQLRATYVTKDDMDQIRSPMALKFSLDGTRLLCGFEGRIHIFDTVREGSDCRIVRLTPSRKSSQGLKGIVSCIHINPDLSQMYAVGTYRGCIGLYDERSNELLRIMHDPHTRAGVSQVQFSADGNYLFSTSRKSNSIDCWDIRASESVLYSIHRPAFTQQRLYFDVSSDGNFVYSGDTDGNLLTFDCGTRETQLKRINSCSVSCVQIHPSLQVVATCSGQRIVDPESDGMDANLQVWSLSDEFGLNMQINDC